MTLPTLTPAILLLVAPFAPLPARRVWRHAQDLLGGAILAQPPHGGGRLAGDWAGGTALRALL